MEPCEVITFCKNDWTVTSFAAFEEMRKSGKLCDITIRLQNRSFTGHRVVLAAGIPYFGELFTPRSGGETEEKEIVLRDLDPGALESLIHFAYRGKIKISPENVHSVLLASKSLQMNEVHEACVKFLSKRLRVSNVLQVRGFARKHKNANLTKSCNRYILQNFEDISMSGDFLNMPRSCIKMIISNDELNVSNEATVFEAIMKWVKSFPSERHAILPELLSEVRLIFLPTDYLLERVACDELVTTSMKCKELVEEVKSYHLSPKRDSLFPNLKKTPRKSKLKKDDITGLYAICHCSTGISLCYRDSVSDTWRDVALFGHSYSIYQMVALKDEIYLFCISQIVTFNIKNLKRKIVGSAGHISENTILPHGKVIYFFPGDGTFKDRVCAFDTEQKKWLKDRGVNISRCNTAVTSLRESIYVTGGRGGLMGAVLDTVEKYNPSSDQWIEMTPMRTPRMQHACTSLNGKVYVCGGSDILETLRTAEIFDPLTNQWNFISPMKHEKKEFSLLSCNSKIYALGGKTLKNKYADIYDPESDQWETGFLVPVGFQFAVLITAALD